MWTSMDAPSDRDFLEQFNPCEEEPEEDEMQSRHVYPEVETCNNDACGVTSDRLEHYKCHVHGCPNPMCCLCVTKCAFCDSETCTEHLAEFAGEKLCPCCIAELKREGAEALKETA